MDNGGYIVKATVVEVVIANAYIQFVAESVIWLKVCPLKFNNFKYIAVAAVLMHDTVH